MTEIFQFYDWCEDKKIWIPLIHTESIADKFKEQKPVSESKDRNQRIAERKQKLSKFQFIKL